MKNNIVEKPLKIKIGLDLDGVLTFVGYSRHCTSRINSSTLLGVETLINVCPMACAELRSSLDSIKSKGIDVSIIIISSWSNNWDAVRNRFFETVLDTKIEGCLNSDYIDMTFENSYERRYINLCSYLNKYGHYDYCLVLDDNEVVTSKISEDAKSKNIIQIPLGIDKHVGAWYDKDNYIEYGFNKESRKNIDDFLKNNCKFNITN